jgi:hypothetical protein
MAKKVTGFTTSIERRKSKTDNHFNKERNLKYGMTQDIIKNHCKDGMTILELFGGIGMTTGYIINTIIPKKLVVNELDKDCVDLLKKNFNKSFIEIKQEDAFKWKDYDFDIAFIDGGFTLGKCGDYVPIFTHIKNSPLKKFVFTDVGVFRFSFTKKEEREEKIKEYLDAVNLLFAAMHFHITEVYKIKSSGICMMVVESGDGYNYIIHNWDKEDENWKKYGIDVYTKNMFFD